MSDKMRAIGLMSGTSMDGVDVALIETDGDAYVAPGLSGFLAYDDEDRALLRSAIKDAVGLDDRTARPGSVAAAEAMISRRHIEAVENFLREKNIARESVDIIGFHGQTILHRPEKQLTLQIGDGPALAKALGVAVAYDFRACDVAAGGQGAPLVPAYHRALAQAGGMEASVVIINIGGVSNLTLLSKNSDPIACDCGPGNALIDDLMLARTGVAMDRDGAMAAVGRVDEAVLARLLQNPYFAKPMPKSLDRNDFSGDAVAALKTEDAAATLTAFTASAIGLTIAALPTQPTLAVICGGGAANPTMMRELKARLPCDVVTAREKGWSAESMEAQAFAFLAVRTQKNLPITFPTTTGVATPLCGGVIVRP